MFTSVFCPFFFLLFFKIGLDIPYELHGQYTTDIITNESVNIIRNHNKTNPLFLYVAHAAVHSSNPYNPLPVPDDVVAKLNHITDNFNRRKYAGINFCFFKIIFVILRKINEILINKKEFLYSCFAYFYYNCYQKNNQKLLN